jgi:hypothetical protein
MVHSCEAVSKTQAGLIRQSLRKKLMQINETNPNICEVLSVEVMLMKLPATSEAPKIGAVIWSRLRLEPLILTKPQ